LRATEVLIEQKVAVVWPVCEVVHREYSRAKTSYRSLPAVIQGVVVDDQPVGTRILQSCHAQVGVHVLRRIQPTRVRGTVGVGADVGRWQ